MTQIAKVAVAAATYAIDKPYDYLVPSGMELSVGCRVTVPFGRGNRTAEGMVLQQSPPVDLLNSGGAKASIRVLAGQCTAGMGRRLTLLRQAFLRTTGSNPTRCIPAASPTPAAPTTRSLTTKVDPNTSRAGGKTSASAAGSPVS